MAIPLPILMLWIQPFEFYSRICRGELPVRRGPRRISRSLPRIHLTMKRLNISHATIQTLRRQNTKFDLRPIEPTAMLWRLERIKICSGVISPSPLPLGEG